MPNALYLTLVCDWTNRAAAEKYNLTEETVKKNRAELVKKSGYEPLLRLDPTVGAAYYGTHAGKSAAHLHAYDPQMGSGVDPKRYANGETEQWREWKLRKQLRQEFKGTFESDSRQTQRRTSQPARIAGEDA
jgi:hypothetical protein